MVGGLLMVGVVVDGWCVWLVWLLMVGVVVGGWCGC